MANPGPNITVTPNSSTDMRVNPSGAASGDGHTVGLTPQDLVSFWGQTPIAQPAAQTGTPNGFTPTAGAGAAVKVDTTFNGGTGAGGTAYSIGDVIKALKAAGILAS